MIHPETQYSENAPDYMGLTAADKDIQTSSDGILKEFGIHKQGLEFLGINVSINRGDITQARILVRSSERKKNLKHQEFYIDVTSEVGGLEDMLSVFSEVNIVIQDSTYTCSPRKKYQTISISDI